MTTDPVYLPLATKIAPQRSPLISSGMTASGDADAYTGAWCAATEPAHFERDDPERPAGDIARLRRAATEPAHFERDDSAEGCTGTFGFCTPQRSPLISSGMTRSLRSGAQRTPRRNGARSFRAG